MKYSLAYGKGSISVEIPERNLVKVLEIGKVPALSDPVRGIREKLDRPNGTPPLARLAGGKKTACILVSDITRPVPNKTILPPLLETLENAGIDRSNILLLIATGLHRPSTHAEKLEIFGPDILHDYRIEDHDARNDDEHVFLGTSGSGVPIRIDRRYFEAEIKILTGLIEPHFMAGFSGGRKSICPGIAGIETISAWHSPKFIEHENSRFGRIDGNPVHAEQLEIAAKSGCDFILNLVIDHNRNILKVVAGELEAAHAEGVRFARAAVSNTLDEPVDLVIGSSAGYPLDATLYQSIKGIVAASEIVKPGGTVIVAAACDKGIGSTELEEIVRKFPEAGDFMAAICSGEYFIVNQWQVEKLTKAINKAKVGFFTEGIPAGELRKYYLDPVDNIDKAICEAMEKYGPDTKIALIPDGPHVLAGISRGATH